MQQRALISLLSAFSGALSPALPASAGGGGDGAGAGEKGAGGHSPSRLCHQSVCKTLSMTGGLEWGKAPLIQRAKKDVNSSQLVCKNWHK